MMAVPYRVCSTLLSSEEVKEVLEHPPNDGISTLPPAKPKGGEVYLIKAADDSQKVRKYTVDNSTYSVARGICTNA